MNSKVKYSREKYQERDTGDILFYKERVVSNKISETNEYAEP